MQAYACLYAYARAQRVCLVRACMRACVRASERGCVFRGDIEYPLPL